ncbi:MAG: hypothetical protein II811_08630 [Spirochaetaceae bacterium]|nr:hypothetical protein [Spirochaetaceae bacterium]
MEINRMEEAPVASVRGFIQGNTVVADTKELEAFNGYEIEIRVLDKKAMDYREACEAMRKLRGSGIWEGNLDEMRECR